MKLSLRISLLLCVLITLTAGFIELGMGRVPVYQHGPVRLWTGDVNGNQNSQQIADPYTLSHVLHGFAFYGALTLVPLPLSIGAMAVGATVLESGWEILENSPLIIERYRSATFANEYSGDSVLNSICDIIACLIGFYIAYKLPWKWTLAIAVASELLMLYLIRDNLTLNIVMLIYPIEAIKHWQMGL